jgi:hypothetical protein
VTETRVSRGGDPGPEDEDDEENEYDADCRGSFAITIEFRDS